MDNPILSVELLRQKNLSLEYLLAAETGILSVIRILALDQRVDVLPVKTEVSAQLLDEAHATSQKPGCAVEYLNVDVVMNGLRKRWEQNTQQLPFLIISDDYIQPRRRTNRSVLTYAHESRCATMSTFRFEHEPLAGNRPALFAMMAMRVMAQLLGAPNEDRPGALKYPFRHRDINNRQCILRHCDNLGAYEHELFPAYHDGAKPICLDCATDIDSNLLFLKLQRAQRN